MAITEIWIRLKGTNVSQVTNTYKVLDVVAGGADAGEFEIRGEEETIDFPIKANDGFGTIQYILQTTGVVNEVAFIHEGDIVKVF